MRICCVDKGKDKTYDVEKFKKSVPLQPGEKEEEEDLENMGNGRKPIALSNFTVVAIIYMSKG